MPYYFHSIIIEYIPSSSPPPQQIHLKQRGPGLMELKNNTWMVVIARWKMLNALGLLNRSEIQVLKSWPLKSMKPRSQNNLPASSKQDGTWGAGPGASPLVTPYFPCRVEEDSSPIPAAMNNTLFWLSSNVHKCPSTRSEWSALLVWIVNRERDTDRLEKQECNSK